MLTPSRWESADITEVVRDQLTLDGDGGRFSIAGARAFLSPEVAVALALVLHELGTNAPQHGSLSSAAGRVDVDWTSANGDAAIDLRSTEAVGPLSELPAERGFGITLIEKSLGSIGGSASLSFDRAGLRSQLRLPARIDIS